MAVMSFSRLAAGGRRSTNTHLLVLVQVDPAVAVAVLLHGLDAALRGDGILHLPRGQTSLAMKGRRGDVVSMGGRPGDAARNEGAAGNDDVV